MNGKHTLVLIVLLLITLLFIGWGSRNDVAAVRENPQGTYIAFVPQLPVGERTVILELSAAGGATMTVDTQNGAAPSVQQGTWTLRENGDVSVAFDAGATREFVPAPDILTLRNPSVDEWGTNVLILARAALPLESQWRWIETREKDGDVILPEGNALFIVRLGNDLRFTVTGDCNTISGNFSLRRGALIVINDVVATKKFCEGSQETAFLGDFAHVGSYNVKESALSLKLPDGEKIMMFERYAGDIPPR
jgi:heat shock protein HslJ